MYELRIPLLSLVVGCAGGISEEEAETVFASMWTVSNDVQAQALTAVSTAGVGKSLTVDVSPGGYEFSGDLNGAGSWSGTVAVEGSASWSPTAYSLDLSLEYIDVTTTSPDLTMNGFVDLSVDVEYSQTSYHYEYSMAGDLDVEGEARGNANFDYSMIVEYDFLSGTYSFEASGDINGHDVSGFSGGLSGSYSF